jgi:hypothetical protein
LKFVAFITAISLLSTTSTLYGSPPPTKISLPQIDVPKNEANIGAAISPMPKGNRAPFTGLLLSPLAVATIISEISSYQEMLEIELARVKAEYEADMKFRLNRLKIEHDADKTVLNTQIEAANKRIIELGDLLQKEIDNRPNVFLWSSLGVLGGIGITLLTVFAVSQVSN